MDESGVDVQVLSVTTPALQNLEPEESVTLARRTNDLVAETVAKYRTRFQGFAHCRPHHRKKLRQNSNEVSPGLG